MSRAALAVLVPAALSAWGCADDAGDTAPATRDVIGDLMEGEFLACPDIIAIENDRAQLAIIDQLAAVESLDAEQPFSAEIDLASGGVAGLQWEPEGGPGLLGERVCSTVEGTVGFPQDALEVRYASAGAATVSLEAASGGEGRRPGELTIEGLRILDHDGAILLEIEAGTFPLEYVRDPPAR